MKKSLLALAVLSSIAGMASAQSSVTIYGIVDAGIARETGGATGSVTKVATGVQQGNRLGFKGVEDLGNGLKAQFQIENGFNLDEGTQRQGALFGRQAYAGLSGGFGEVNLGRQYNPIFNVLNAIDPFNTGLEGASTNLMMGGTLGVSATGSTVLTAASHSSNVRVNNSITYSIPTIAGFNATALYGAGEVGGNNNAGRTIGASGSYTNGPLMAAVAYNKVTANSVAATAAVAAAPATGTLGVPGYFAGSNVVAANGGVTVPDSKLILVGGTYNFGVATANLGYQTEKNDAGTLNTRNLLVGTMVPVGPAGLVLASFIKSTDKTTAGTGGAKQYAIGYTYNLSKRSNLYTSYARITNDSTSSNYVGDASNGGGAVNAGHTSGGFSVGLRHKF